MGAEVVFFVLSDLDLIEGDAAINLQAVLNQEMDVIPVTDEETMEFLAQDLEEADLVVDALLGTGLNSDLRGDYAKVVEMINDSPGFVAAVDIPTGLNGATGQVMGCCVVADLTVTFGLPKLGQAIHPGLDLCGELVTVDICLAEEAFASQAWDVFPGRADRRRPGLARTAQRRAQGSGRSQPDRGRLAGQDRSGLPGRRGGGPIRLRPGHGRLPGRGARYSGDQADRGHDQPPGRRPRPAAWPPRPGRH